MNLGVPIATGNTAAIYLCDNKIMKIYHDHLPDSESDYEASKQSFAISCGLPVPKILDVTKVNGKQAIIMEHIKGKTLGKMVVENKDHLEYYLKLSVNIQQNIHAITTDALEPMSIKLRRQIESAPQLDSGQKSTLIKKLKAMPFENRLCHGDFHLFNLIMSDARVMILDWVDASAGNRCADVYRTYLIYSQFSSDVAETYLRLYCEKNYLKRADVFQWAPIIAGARLAENVGTENSNRLIEIVNQYS